METFGGIGGGLGGAGTGAGVGTGESVSETGGNGDRRSPPRNGLNSTKPRKQARGACAHGGSFSRFSDNWRFLRLSESSVSSILEHTAEEGKSCHTA